MQAKGERTRQAILDAAESLFGDRNFDAISVRDIADKAEVLLGVITHHFGNKETLFELTVARRAADLNNIRLAELRQHPKPTVEQILEAFIRPVLTRANEPSWRSYMRIVAQITHEERWSYLNRRLFRPTAMEFLKAMRAAMPDTPPELVARGFVYTVFVMLGVAHQNIRLAELGAYPATDFDRAYETVLPFVTGGLRALTDAS